MVKERVLKQIIWLPAILAEIAIVGILLRGQESFLLQIIIVSQISVAIGALAYHRQQGVEESDCMKLGRPSRFALPLLLIAITIFWVDGSWIASSNWAEAGKGMTHEFGDITAIAGLVTAGIATIGSILLQRRDNI